jgi:succinoglycan biosynthesis transport protein ExoP
MNTTSIEYNPAVMSGVSSATNKTILDYIEGIKRRFSVFLATFISVLVIAIGIAFLWPSSYESSSTILIEQQEIPQDLVRSTITSFADQRIEMIKARVMTYTNLVLIIDEFKLYEDERKSEPLEVVVEDMREDIDISVISADVVDPRSGRPMPATIAFVLSYKSESPELAQKVADKLTSLFLNENFQNRKQMAVETEGFLENEAKRLSKKMAELENQLANFKERHFGSLPELANLNITILERTERELLEVEREIRSIKERKIYLESELAQLSPNLSIFSEDGKRILSPLDRLKTLESKYVQMSAVYSKDHPDILRVQKEIEALKASNSQSTSNITRAKVSNDLEGKLENLRLEYDSLKEKYTDDHPDVARVRSEISTLERAALTVDDDQKLSVVLDSKPDNPAYIQLQANLNAANAELEAVIKKQDKLNKKLELYETRITDAPQVEKQFRTLSRDYDNAWKKYQEIKAKQMEAQLASELEMERKGERFTLIDPARMPEEPVSPNRKAILLFGLLLAIGSAVGLVILLESMDRTIRGANSVTALLNVAPLAGIPYIATVTDKKRRTGKLIALILAVVVIIVGGLAAVHYLKAPLDVIWYVVLRKFGIDG